MDTIDRCVLCFRKVTGHIFERCWYCDNPLCCTCSDHFGVCGCPGSDQAQREIVEALIVYERFAGRFN